MIETRKSFCIVCIANYCRSPVAEHLFKKKFGDKYEFFSAGIAPVAAPSMDPRSIKFLEENYSDHNFHTPKRISRKMLDYFDKFLAVDPYVLNRLNISYPKYRQKFLLLTAQFSNIIISDPYNLNANDYKKTMDNIKHITENINLEKI